MHLAIGLHVAHWKIAGKTLAPLELNEVLYTLELGIVTAGFLFMASVCVATAIFGRFFCSWGCHILALEDSCAWLLEKLRIRPKPVRSRALLLVPPAAMLYMFAWPHVKRIAQGDALPRLHWASDADGWASLATTDFARNLPGPWVAAVTFAVCGFVIVYVLGSRAFCKYVCPYGAVFGLLDRTAPGRIVVHGDCSGCGRCTAVCSSHVRVHAELCEFGQVVDPACLKDLDCVAACPRGAVRYGFTLPAVLRSRFSFRRKRPPYDFDAVEELALAVVFVVALLALRGLYDVVPFFLALALSAIASYVVTQAGRTLVRRDVPRLARDGRITRKGVLFLCGAAVIAAILGHSSLFRWHERRAYAALDAAAVAVERDGTASAATRATLERAREHLEASQRLAPWISPRLESRVAELHALRGDLDAAAQRYASVVARAPRDLAARLAWARVLVAQARRADGERVLRAGIEGLASSERERPAARRYLCAAHEMLGNLAASRGDHVMARAAFQAALSVHADSFAAHRGLGDLFADEGRLADGATHLRRAVELEPHSVETRYNLAVVLSALGSNAEALVELRTVAEVSPADPDVQSNLGFVLLALADARAAEAPLRRALALRPDHAAAHFNLARALVALDRDGEAQTHFDAAARTDRRFAPPVR